MNKSAIRVFSFILVILLVMISGCKKSSTESKNSPPVVNSITITPTSVPTSGLVSVVVVTSDPDQESLTNNISVDDGTLVGSEKERIWIAPSTAGTYDLTVTVSDRSGGETTDTATLTVTAPITQITGIAQFEDGVSGDLSGTVGLLYYTWEKWYNLIYDHDEDFDVMTIGEMAYFTITDIDPGSYWLEIIKDNNTAVGVPNFDDYWGLHGSAEAWQNPIADEIVVTEGQTSLCEIIIYEIP